VVSATIDWSWDVTVVPVAFAGLAAVLLAPAGPRPQRPRREALFARLPVRVVVALAAVLAMLAIAFPLVGASYIRDSRSHFNAGQLGLALQDARHAQQVQPYAAGPRLQEALVLEQAKRLPQAATAVRSAIAKEPTNPALWTVLSRIEANRGQAAPAVAAYRRARALDPHSALLRRVSAR
jgi:Flp pilus assembly protein TadD